MTRLSPFVPAGVQLFYHSVFGVHVATLPTLPYNSAGDTFDTWDSSTIASGTMISDLVTTFLPLYPATVVFDTYRIYTQADEESLPFLQKIANFTDVIGTNGTPGWTKAAQLTLSALGEDGSKARLVFLDSSSTDDWDAVFTLTGSVIPPIMTEWSNTARGWSTRGDSRPNTFLELSKTLNEKLRREYRMF